jgi:hypothetical protein
MKSSPTLPVTILCRFVGGCETVGTGIDSISDPVSEHQDAAHEVARFRDSMIHFKANPAFEDMNKRQLNRALEELNHATNRLFFASRNLQRLPH